MCKICDDLRDDARQQARYVDELRGLLSAGEATLGDLRGRLADHAALHVYREPDDTEPPLPFGGWDE